MVPSYMVAQLTLFTARPVYSVHVGLTEAMGMALVPRKCTLKKKKKNAQQTGSLNLQRACGNNDTVNRTLILFTPIS